RHPQVALQVSVENTQDIVRHLLNHELDVACVEGAVNHPQLHVVHWRDDTLSVYAAPGHALSQQPTLAPAHFKGAQWILREPGSAMRTLAEQALTRLPAGQIFLE